MATTSNQNNPLSRLSRLGFGLGFKLQSTSQHQARLNEQVEDLDDDEWYIPYNGPYELPHVPIQERKGGNSWGDAVFGGESDGLDDQELYDRYGMDIGHDGWKGNMGDDGKPYGLLKHGARERSQSFVSGRMVSTGAVDPNRPNRRSTISSGRQLLSVPAPSFINLDAAGGVGESPMPPSRPPKDTANQNRTSVSNLFAFASQSRKTPTSPAFRHDGGASKSTPRSPGLASKGPTLLRRLSPGRTSPKKRSKQVTALPLDIISSHDSMATDEEDYYNSYYSTLINTPASSKTRSPRPTPNDSSPNIRSSKPTAKNQPSHPYAYMSSTSSVPPTPHTAPPIPTPKIQFAQSGPAIFNSHGPPILTLTKSSEVNLGALQPSSLVDGLRRLKNSMSTPDLRGVQLSQNSSRASNHIPRGKERWLSAETWCDAILLPRPRLRLKRDGDSEYIGSGRIVSPPGSPLHEKFGTEWTEKDVRNNGLPSRVLAHSRSLAKLRDDSHQTLDPSSSSSPIKANTLRSRGDTMPSQHRNLPPPLPPSTSVATRRKSLSVDDLALASPAPSLTRVIHDGQVFESQRRQWNTQATESFQNKRSRDISRTRSKSLSQKHGRRKDDSANQVRENIDFLAARSLLGNQDIITVAGPSAPKSEGSSTNHTTSFGRTSHSHSNSLEKTLSKSSKSQSRHSRNDSWGKSAIKMAKTTMCGLIGDPSLLSPLDEKACALEHALRGDGTRVIKLADSVHPPSDVDPSGPSHITTPARSGMSPSPSGASDIIGIALTTPPLTEEALDREPIRLLAHPYAQGGLYTLTPQPTQPLELRPEQGSAYAGPHPSSAVAIQSPEPADIASRHRLPPHAAHPFAWAPPQASDQITPRGPERLGTPACIDKSPAGIVEKRAGISTPVRPSPSGVAKSSPGGEPLYVSLEARNSRPILDTSGVGEALTNALRSQRSLNELSSYHGDAPIYNGLAQEAPSYFTVKPTVTPSRPPHLQFGSKSSGRDSLSPANASASTGPSPDATSDSSSPQRSPLPLGSPDDLDHFHDLFFKPSADKQTLGERTSGSGSLNPPVPWDISTRSHRTGSGLTSLARQLSEEFEQMTTERRGSQSTASARLLSTHGSRRPTDSGLEFVFEEMSRHPRSESPLQDNVEPLRDSPFAFRPSGVIPEDIDSRASSPTEGVDEDVTERFRVRRVEAVSTPPATSSDHRNSLAGHVSFPNDHDEGVQHATHSLVTSVSPISLQPSSAVPTRSSYLTGSTGSRISGLSDFPNPPRDSRTPGHTSLLSSYFDEIHSQGDTHTSATPQVPSRRLTFGDGNENVEDIIAALSSHI